MEQVSERQRHANHPQEDTPPWAQVIFAPPDEWVSTPAYDAGIPPKEGDHLTQLAWTREVHWELGRSFHFTATRLESQLAVQHESQWSIELDPKTQKVAIHWLRIVRNGERFDQLKRDQLRLIQRENQLEQHVINGRWTLLAVLSDVSPGDIVEAAFTFESSNPVRPDGKEEFFTVPPGQVVGHFHLDLRFDPRKRSPRWSASSDAPAMRENETAEGLKRWTWSGDQLRPREPEPHQPGSSLDCIWIQVTDLADWAELAVGADEIWRRQDDQSSLDAIPAFAVPEMIDDAAILRLIRHIQDEYRYLSVDLGKSGWVPAPPATVVKRRYGDCKDLVWLATTVLRRWGLAARPILVGTGLRERVATLLPMSLLFNHALLEVTSAGRTRWFDLTERDQGGDFPGQAVSWFHHGLPVDSQNNDLTAQPGAPARNTYFLEETFLIDTSRHGKSMLEVYLRAEGVQADLLRRKWQSLGAVEFANQHEKELQRRFKDARREGTQNWRDDRENNICEVAEAFEIGMVVYPADSGQRAVFEVPRDLVLQCVPPVADAPRREPLELPRMLEVIHRTNICAPSLRVGKTELRHWNEPEFEAKAEELKSANIWTKTSHLKIKDNVAADRIASFKKEIETFLQQSTWLLLLPWGRVRNRPRQDFGMLPAAGASTPTLAAPPQPVLSPTPARPLLPAQELKRTSSGGGRRHRRSTSHMRGVSTHEIPPWLIRFFIGFAVVMTFSLFKSCVTVIGQH